MRKGSLSILGSRHSPRAAHRRVGAGAHHDARRQRAGFRQRQRRHRAGQRIHEGGQHRGLAARRPLEAHTVRDRGAMQLKGPGRIGASLTCPDTCWAHAEDCVECSSQSSLAHSNGIHAQITFILKEIQETSQNACFSLLLAWRVPWSVGTPCEPPILACKTTWAAGPAPRPRWAP
jgi:hypothetical protein